MTKQTGQPTDFESFLTWEALTEMLSYDPATGEFRWVKARQLGGWKGRLAGGVDAACGYKRIKILGRSFFASRLAWLYMKKRWPTKMVDHKNGNPADDRWVNLRESSRQENGRNHKVHANSKTGVNGVYWHSTNQKWAAHFSGANGKRVFLGTFATLEEATAARKGAEAVHFGEFPRDVSERSVPPAAPREHIAPPDKPQKIPRRGVISDFESFLTQEALVEVLSYDPATGIFVWRDNKTNPRVIKIGALAGGQEDGKYRDITVMGRRFRTHRLAWLYMTGQWPQNIVDHINGVKSDNRWANLRAATRSQNAHNSKLKTTNKSGATGVSFRPDSGKWRAKIRHEGKLVNLGTYATADEASIARKKFEDEFLGDFKRSA